MPAVAEAAESSSRRYALRAMPISRAAQRKIAKPLRQFALAMPGAWEDHPWGESVAKVGKKVFAFLGSETWHGGLTISLKLPASSKEALRTPIAEPTSYGLGKSGWVTLFFARGKAPPIATLLAWIEESYCAVAPKKLVKEWMERAS